MVKTRALTLVVLSALAFSMAGCGDGRSSSSSSSSSSSNPSGLSGSERDRYNNLSPEGKKYVDDQMRAYDKANKR
jgi:hypothetical protein